uniref:Uncharacterized protein n=1 Tax=Chromera velia CCMP2878 TaxID=1169474 RepID=A0A0K6S9Q6_9ALVE|eukprot:Cvel_31587.t3-p1 / transcript=Cvel_31587.t3 / gene=Cvel_31587 / organism=Chromera_velia_CCMP2878 / gene_product=UDP-glucuronate:xylan alpha-glucuronosyltransferase, putative / transcript_product=UDP-glucuronate:xylan alpha-glucuronosyltransferase, putative / location=Cvel_scaffold4735:5077-7699(+) / protein_length=300 / sequence_SO=supercontig / SO=protein_coding / is_pseudo=false
MEAFVTLVTSDSFVVGVEVLACSLRKTGTLRPLVVLYTPQLTPSAVEKLSSLSSHIFGVRASEDGSANQDEGEWPMKEISRLQAEKEFCVILHRVGPLPNPHEKCVHVDGWVNSGFTKLRIWQLTVFSQVVYVDADCVVCEAIDDLFDLERSEVWHPSCPPSRVLNGNCDDDRSGGTKGKEAAEKELKPVEQNERKPKGSPQQGRVLMSNGGGECEEEEEKCGDTAKDDEERRGSRKEARQITRLPAFAPDVCPPDKFNAGVVVLDPDANLFEQMMDAVDNLGSHDEVWLSLAPHDMSGR